MMHGQKKLNNSRCYFITFYCIQPAEFRTNILFKMEHRYKMRLTGKYTNNVFPHA